MSGICSLGRFEWLTIAGEDDDDPSGGAGTAVFTAKKCPQCGWVDGDAKFAALSGEPGLRECFRCGYRWDLAAEIRAFFAQEGVEPPPVRVAAADPAGFERFYRGRKEADPAGFDLKAEAERLCLRKGFDQLLALATAGIQRFDHQVNTAVKVLKQMRGRALLADEVGLGKTVEAGLILKELVLRGLAQTVLIIVPAALQAQWKEEMACKFEETFAVFRRHRLREEDRRLIVSYDVAKRRPALKARKWDLLILDESHRLKNRATLLSRFVRAIEARYLLALSATPVQNTLSELYAQVDLVQPGKLGTFRSYRRSFISRTNACEVIPGRESALRDALADIMVRNRRDQCRIEFKKRRVGIYTIEASAEEKALYDRVTDYVKKEFKRQFRAATGKTVHMLSLITLQREVMSSPAAVAATLLKIATRRGYPAETRRSLEACAAMAAAIPRPSKMAALQEIVGRFAGHRFVVFTEFVKSMEFIARQLQGSGLPVFAVSGRLDPAARAAALARFRDTPGSVLVSTETGGEGLNLQFCHHLVNYDLPWNPTRVEQRIGRLHRIGQEHEVVVFNLVCKDTIEAYIVDILAKKLRMFEMVIGECGTVLGHLASGRSFEQMLVDVWLRQPGDGDPAEGPAALAAAVEQAREAYGRSRKASSVLNRIGGSA